MTIVIVNGEERTLEIRSKNGVDWSSDLIGNFTIAPDHDEDGNTIMSEGDYDWWVDLIEQHVKMDEMIEQAREDHSDDVVDEIVNQPCDDLGDYVKRVIGELGELSE